MNRSLRGSSRFQSLSLSDSESKRLCLAGARLGPLDLSVMKNFRILNYNRNFVTDYVTRSSVSVLENCENCEKLFLRNSVP